MHKLIVAALSALLMQSAFAQSKTDQLYEDYVGSVGNNAVCDKLRDIAKQKYANHPQYSIANTKDCEHINNSRYKEIRTVLYVRLAEKKSDAQMAAERKTENERNRKADEAAQAARDKKATEQEKEARSKAAAAEAKTRAYCLADPSHLGACACVPYRAKGDKYTSCTK